MTVTIILLAAIVVSSFDLATAMVRCPLKTQVNPMPQGPRTRPRVRPMTRQSHPMRRTDAAPPILHHHSGRPFGEPRPPQPLMPVEAQLIPVMDRNSFRPPAPYSAALKPKPSPRPHRCSSPMRSIAASGEINRARGPSRTDHPTPFARPTKSPACSRPAGPPKRAMPRRHSIRRCWIPAPEDADRQT